MITIVHSEAINVGEFGLRWACWLEISRDGEAWMLSATAPGELEEGELQAYFDARENELWRLAQQKQYQPDVYEHIRPKRVLKAFAAVVLDEINVLRVRHDLPARTKEQLVQAIKNKLKEN